MSERPTKPSLESLALQYQKSNREEELLKKWHKISSAPESASEKEKEALVLLLAENSINEMELATERESKQEGSREPVPDLAKKARAAMDWIWNIIRKGEIRGDVHDTQEELQIRKELFANFTDTQQAELSNFEFRAALMYPLCKKFFRKQVLDSSEQRALSGDQDAIHAIKVFAEITNDKELLSRIHDVTPKSIESDWDTPEMKDMLAELGLENVKLKPIISVHVPVYEYRK